MALALQPMTRDEEVSNESYSSAYRSISNHGRVIVHDCTFWSVATAIKLQLLYPIQWFDHHSGPSEAQGVVRMKAFA